MLSTFIHLTLYYENSMYCMHLGFIPFFWPMAMFSHFREMFWTDWGGTPKIEMSDMDGQHRVVLIKSGIYWPNGLAIDIYQPEKSRILYYTDAYKDIIGSYNLYTKTNRVHSQAFFNFRWTTCWCV